VRVPAQRRANRMYLHRRLARFVAIHSRWRIFSNHNAERLGIFSPSAAMQPAP
jgi:hypothetical protein